MGAMEDGWKRILRKIQQELDNAYASLKIVSEDLGVVAVDTWTSPATAVAIGTFKHFSYVNNALTYTGQGTVLVEVEATMAVEVGGGGLDAVIEVTGGKNDTPSDDYAMPSSSSFGSVIYASANARFIMENGDTLNAYVKQTSEAAGANITINKAIFNIKTIDLL